MDGEALMLGDGDNEGDADADNEGDADADKEGETEAEALADMDAELEAEGEGAGSSAVLGTPMLVNQPPQAVFSLPLVGGTITGWRGAVCCVLSKYGRLGWCRVKLSCEIPRVKNMLPVPAK